MNWSICRNTWKQCATSKFRVCILFVLFMWPIFSSTLELCFKKQFSPQLYSNSSGCAIMILACATGVIGSQLSDGTLSLMMSRPITTTRLVLSKWFAVGFAAFAVVFTQLLAEIVVTCFRTPYLLDPGAVLANAVERALLCFGLGAVITLLSTFVSGVKDLALYLVIAIGFSLLSLASQINERSASAFWKPIIKLLRPFVEGGAAAVQLVMLPYIDLSSLTLISSTLAYLSVVAFCLSLSIWLLNRKELPYGAD